MERGKGGGEDAENEEDRSTDRLMDRLRESFADVRSASREVQ